jgi:hypothetical protein
MKVFISWSGERSRRVAELLHTWIECVIQAVEPWVSSSDIDRGALWFTQIIDELTTTHGIICLTRDNKEKPWILFEAGALAKGLNSSRIYTLLVDLNPEDVRDPLAQFNHTRPTEGDMFKLVSSINKGLESRGLKEGVLRNAFAVYWPQFQDDFKKILDETEQTAAPKIERPKEDVLTEILNTVRGLDKRVRTVESSISLNPKQSMTNDTGRDSGRRIAIARANDGNLIYKQTHPKPDPLLNIIWEGIRNNISNEDIVDELDINAIPYLRSEIIDKINEMRRSG